MLVPWMWNAPSMNAMQSHKLESRNTLVAPGSVATTFTHLHSCTDIRLSIVEMLAQSHLAGWFCSTANKNINLTSLNCAQYSYLVLGSLPTPNAFLLAVQLKEE